MPITPPKARRTGMFGRRLLTVFDVSCPPAEAVARCIDFWRPIGTEEDSPALSEQFANRGWSGTELTVVTKKNGLPDFSGFNQLGRSAAVFPGLTLGALAAYLTSHAVRAHLNRRHIIVAAHPTPDTKQSSTALWCIPWNTPHPACPPRKGSSRLVVRLPARLPLPAGHHCRSTAHRCPRRPAQGFHPDAREPGGHAGRHDCTIHESLFA